MVTVWINNGEKKQTEFSCYPWRTEWLNGSWVTFDGINSTALWHPNALLSEISKLHNLPLQHRAIKGLVKRMCSKCNQAKQSYARMTDIMERGKIGLLIIAHQYCNNKPFHSPYTPFLGNETFLTFRLHTGVCIPSVWRVHVLVLRTR